MLIKERRSGRAFLLNALGMVIPFVEHS
jgi:hypothetical protein